MNCAAFPFEPNYLNVLGSQMHYVDVPADDDASGQDPILLLHGNPTSSYLWRNVIPGLTSKGRVIAVDLIGMGKSDKPDIDYRFVDHARYLKGFIEGLGLQNITLVIHDWGSALGYHYAHQHPDNVKGIAMMEGIAGLPSMKGVPAQMRAIFSLFRNPIAGRAMIQGLNFFVDRVLPMSVMRKLSKEEMGHYRAPYPNFASRKPLFRWPNEIPFDGKPEDVAAIVSGYLQWLETTDIPKLLLWFKPGAILRKDDVKRIEASWPNLKSVYVGSGLHFVQEDHPQAIAAEVCAWMDESGLSR